jgi:hypothetical protein
MEPSVRTTSVPGETASSSLPQPVANPEEPTLGETTQETSKEGSTQEAPVQETTT